MNCTFVTPKREAIRDAYARLARLRSKDSTCASAKLMAICTGCCPLPPPATSTERFATGSDNSGRSRRMNSDTVVRTGCCSVTQRGYGFSSYMARTRCDTASAIGVSSGKAVLKRRSNSCSCTCSRTSGANHSLHTDNST